MAVSYRRILLKLGGEALAGAAGFGIDPDHATEVATMVKEIKDYDIEAVLTDRFCNFLSHRSTANDSNLVNGAMLFWTFGETEIFQFSDYF